MKHSLRLGLLFTALLAPQAALGADARAVVFGNGMLDDRLAAHRSMKALRERLFHFYEERDHISRTTFDDSYSLRVAYNQTKCKTTDPNLLTDWSCFRDLYEAIVHPVIPTMPEVTDSLFWGFLSGLDEVSISFGSLLDFRFEAVARALEPVFTTNADLAEQLDTYREQFSAGRKVVVVAHSQGNFFANDAYAELTAAEQQNLGVVAVATPASFVAGSGPYTTFHEDFIRIVPGSLPPNACNPDCGGPFACHSFVGSYLAAEEGRRRILSDIDSTLTRLTEPSAGPNFTNALGIQIGPYPLGLVVADFDGDQRNDIAVNIYNSGRGDHVSVLRNIGAPGHLAFDIQLDIPIGDGPEGLAAGDLNNDGKVDLVSANADSVNITMLRNTSSRGFIDFQPVFPALFQFGTPHQVAIADYDKDGRPDLIVTSNSGRLVSVFHHASDPNTFDFDYRRDYDVDAYINDLAVADIDRDSRPDILVPMGDSRLLALFQNASIPGLVQTIALPPLETGAAHYNRGIAVGDLDNDPDHTLDVVIAANDGVGVFQNSSSPEMFHLSRTDLPTDTNAGSVAIGDLDKDGFPDVVVANPDESTISILHNRSVGRQIILAPLDLRPATGSAPITVVLEDVDGDGWLDIVVANRLGNNISIFLNKTGRQ